MNTKICSDKRCKYNGAPQPITNFCKDKQFKDGLHVYCRSCRSRRSKELRERDPSVAERARLATMRYRETEHGKQRIKSYYTSSEYREHANAYAREYTKRPEVRVSLAMKQARYRTRNSLKDRARRVTVYALRSGQLTKTDYCEWCGKPSVAALLEAHHWRGYDPDHWLDVKFVHADPCHLACEAVKPENWPRHTAR